MCANLGTIGISHSGLAGQNQQELGVEEVCKAALGGEKISIIVTRQMSLPASVHLFPFPSYR